jgi:hypothetical protein
MTRACGNWAWYSPEEGLRRFYCGSAGCDRVYCKQLFWSRRVRLITALIEEYSLTKFFTLTLDPGKTLGDPWEYISLPWSRFRKRMARRFSGFKFVAVLESHKTRDWPHIHGFTNVWLHQRSWSSMWDACGGGKVVWVERVETPELSEYVSKSIEVARYVGKEQLVGGYKHKRNRHTLWRSKHCKAKYELTQGGPWCILKENVYDEQGNLTEWGERLEANAHGKDKLSWQDVEATCSTLSQ